MATGDLDGDGRDDVIIDFPGGGIWIWRNNGIWAQLHGFNSSFFAVGHLDAGAGADVIIDFPGSGLWINYNNDLANWRQLHGMNSQKVAVGDFDGTGRLASGSTPTMPHGDSCIRPTPRVSRSEISTLPSSEVGGFSFDESARRSR